MIKKWLAKLNQKDLLIIIAIILLNILSRLVYILNNGFFIDGDEAILGTVIQDFLNNHHLQLFLYGQTYGLVFFETLLGSLVSFFFGINIFTLKMTMLLFWLADLIVLYYLGKKLLISRRLAGLAVLLISFVPVWFDWATKARIGYLLALLLSNIIILLALSRKKVIRIVIISLSLIIIYYAQPLWLVVVSPFVVYYFFKDYKFKEAAVLIISSLVFLVISRLILFAIGFNFQMQNKLGFDQLARNIKNIFRYYSTAYSGRFFDAAGLKMNYVTTLDSGIFIGILLLVIIYDLYLAVRKKIAKSDALFLGSVIAYLLFMLFYNGEEYHYRYLLPIFIPSVFLILLAVKKLPQAQLRKSFYFFLVIYSLFSLVCGLFFYTYTFPPINDGYTEVERIEFLGKYLQANNIKCVYALDWIISQHLNYFRPEIKVRHQEIDPRRPWDSVKADAGQKSNECALVGLWYQLPLFSSLYKLDDIMVISQRYLVHLHPQREDLLKLKFKLTN